MGTIRFWRGLESERLTVTPREGEPLFATDSKKLYVGDGVTPGGVPITAGEGGGGVDSVNGQLGVVVLDTDDIADTPTRRYLTQAQKDQIGLNATDIAALETAMAALGNLSALDEITVAYFDSTGATNGQLPVADGTGGVSWQDAPESLPPGGTAGQILTKQSATDGDAEWEDPEGNSSWVFNQTPTGTINGTNTTFTLPEAASNIILTLNGMVLKPGAGNDYTLSGSTITMLYAPATGSQLLVSYTTSSAAMIDGSNSIAWKELAVGTKNGTNTVFTTSGGRPYIGGSLQVYVNGIAQGTSVTETTPTTGTFTLDVAPASTDEVEISYQFVLSVTGNSDTVDGYHADATPSANTILVLDSSGKISQAAFKQVAFSAYDNGTAQSIPITTFTHVNMGTESYDTGDYNHTTGYFTPSVAGYYQINAFVGLSSVNDQGTVHVAIRKNGSNWHWTRIRQSGTGEAGGMVSAVVYANGTTDTYDIAVYSSNATTIAGSILNCWWNGAKVGV